MGTKMPAAVVMGAGGGTGPDEARLAAPEATRLDDDQIHVAARPPQHLDRCRLACEPELGENLSGVFAQQRGWPGDAAGRL